MDFPISRITKNYVSPPSHPPCQINVSVVTRRKDKDGVPGQIHVNPVFTVDLHLLRNSEHKSARGARVIRGGLPGTDYRGLDVQSSQESGEWGPILGEQVPKCRLLAQSCPTLLRPHGR